MSTVINTNVAALSAQRALFSTAGQLSTALQRLTSGLRINSAKDDAAGLAIAERLTTQVRGYQQAIRNAGDGISVAQIAEGGLDSITVSLQRMRELSVQAANYTNTESDRSAIQAELEELKKEITRVAEQTRFNGNNLLDGSFQNATFQVGANVGETINIFSIQDSKSSALGNNHNGFVTGPLELSGSPSTPSILVPVASEDYQLPVNWVGPTPTRDAKSIKTAIDSQSVAGLAVTATGASVSGSFVASATTAGVATLTIDHYATDGTLSATTVSLSGSGYSSPPTQAEIDANLNTVVAAVNAQTGLTGVSASRSMNSVTLNSTDGRNFAVSFAANTYTGSTASDFGIVASGAVNRGTVSMAYAAPPLVNGNVDFSGFGFSQNSFEITRRVATVDVMSIKGAETTLKSIDTALSTVSSARAQLGATINRFEQTVSNLRITVENQMASRSRIQDADFAHETAALTRAQILQQSGMAILGQANAIPQNVLALLRA
jgi:flagellin